MREARYKSSILLSIFKRNGGEGTLTKIISDHNKLNFLNQTALLEGDEQALLCFKQDELNWLLITNNRILEERKGVRLTILNSELVEVSLAMQEEFKDMVMNKQDFTRLVLKDCAGRQHIVELEKGQSYQGVYQMLFHIASKNNGSH